MTIPASGAISIADIANEFGGTTPHSLSEYYSGGSLVYTGAVGYPGGIATVIPTSGVTSLSRFRGASRKINLTISSNQTNLNLRTWALANGWSDTNTFLEITIASGIYLLSNSTSTPALTISGSFPIGLRLINNGYIVGYGGAGGGGSPNSSGGAGASGGTGISTSSSLFIVNNNTIAGGGGGGGGGAGSTYEDNYGGGGGGGGATYGAAGGGGGGSGPGTGTGRTGSAGTLSAGGAGGASNYAPGGAGGGWGANGAAGTNANRGSGGSGGSAGNYVSGNSYITWEATGTRLGNVS